MNVRSWYKLCMIALLMPAFQCYATPAPGDTLRITVAESEKDISPE